LSPPLGEDGRGLWGCCEGLAKARAKFGGGEEGV